MASAAHRGREHGRHLLARNRTLIDMRHLVFLAGALGAVLCGLGVGQLLSPSEDLGVAPGGPRIIASRQPS